VYCFGLVQRHSDCGCARCDGVATSVFPSLGRVAGRLYRRRNPSRKVCAAEAPVLAKAEGGDLEDAQRCGEANAWTVFQQDEAGGRALVVAKSPMRSSAPDKYREGGEGGPDEGFEHDGGAVGGDLDDVFAGVGVGVGEGGDDGFVDGLGVRGGSIEDLGESGAGGFERAADADEAGGDGLGVGVGEAEDADASAAGGSGDGGDGFGASIGAWGGVHFNPDIKRRAGMKPTVSRLKRPTDNGFTLRAGQQFSGELQENAAGRGHDSNGSRTLV
jgi:hypothetical protein